MTSQLSDGHMATTWSYHLDPRNKITHAELEAMSPLTRTSVAVIISLE
jgi:hypothetical protein